MNLVDVGRKIRADGDAIIGPENTAEVMSLVTGMSLNRLKEILDAEHDLRCIVSPFKAGDTVRFNCPVPCMHGTEMRGVALSIYCACVGHECRKTIAEIRVDNYGSGGVYEGSTTYSVPIDEVRREKFGLSLKATIEGEEERK